MSEQVGAETLPGQTEAAPEGKKKRRPVPRPRLPLGLLTLEGLAEELGLPLKWLRREVREGKLPCTQVGPRLLFDPQRIARVLQDRAYSKNQYGEYPRD
jgi:hypothetical protein